MSAGGRPASPDEDAYGHCAGLVREADPDRFFAALFAPADKRSHLMALYAFSAEIARTREAVSEPRLGERPPRPRETRPHGGRPARAGAARGDVQANPVARALDATLTRFRLPRAALVGLIDARVFDLYDDPMPAVIDLEGYCGETSSILIQLAALVLAEGRDAGAAEAAGHAGVAYAITGLLRAFPWHARRGQIYVPRDILERNGVTRDDIVLGRGGPGLLASLAEMRALARVHLAQATAFRAALPAEVQAAFLPLALVPCYLARMDRAGYDPFRSVIERPLWRRQITLWRAARRAAG